MGGGSLWEHFFHYYNSKVGGGGLDFDVSIENNRRCQLVELQGSWKRKSMWEPFFIFIFYNLIVGVGD